jgi:hypothetical protein
MGKTKFSDIWHRFTSASGLIIFGGAAAGMLAALLTNWGNPLNKGLTVTCFIREITGALNLHQSASGQYLRPEIMGLALGAFLTSMAFREFNVRGGSSPLIRFCLGFFVMLGAEVFLACPTHTLVRLAGGDLNAATGLAGLVAGILIGVVFLKMRFNLGKAIGLPRISGLVIPVVMMALLLLLVLSPDFITFSTSGSAAHRATIWISLSAGLFIGFMAQRTRLCFMAGWRNLFWLKNIDFFRGIVAFFLTVLVTNYALGNFSAGGLYHWGFSEQPYAVNNQLWNFLSMVLVGLASALLGGCPLRQTILSGEGDTDASFTLLGFFAGAPVAQHFLIKSNETFYGVNTYGPLAVMIGLAFCVTVGFVMRERH